MTKTINGTVMNMITVGNYQPIAGLGLNTVRKMSGKYSHLSIGDEVEMIYKDTPDSDTMNGIERLKVSSLAMIPFHVLIDSLHVDMNHGDFDTPEDFLDFMLQCYGEFDTEDHFLVVYFE